MKSDAISQKFPANREAWEALIAEAPGEDRPATPEENADWNSGVAVKEGGYPAVRAALAKKRGAGRAAKKILLSVRYSPEVVEYFKATGEGWQTRMDAALKEWIEAHPLA